MPGSPDQTLSHYRLIEKIGEGGMGVVWKAVDTVLGRTVAVKVLPADVARDQTRRRMFLDEARLASSLSEAHIAQVHEFGREGDLDFIVMEYVEGKALNKILHGRPLPPDKVASIGLQVAHALSKAHRKGLLHRDLKPANILVTPDGEVKVVDFGLAILFTRSDSNVETQTRTVTLPGEDGTSHQTGRRALMGTIPYMSPEQARGEDLDPRSDIFSLGTVLYEMTTGQRPFTGADNAEILREILAGHLVPVYEHVPKVPLDLHKIIEKTLAPKRTDRYQSTEDLTVDLRHLLRDLESGSSPSFEDLKVAGAPRRIPWRVATAAVGLALVLILSGSLAVKMLWRGGKPAPELAAVSPAAQSLAVLPFLTPDAPDLEYMGDGITEGLINNLSQISRLRVMARGTVFHYKGEEADPRKIGKELRVSAVLTGRILKQGDGLVIKAELVDAATGYHVWGGQYQRALPEVVGVEELIAGEIARGLKLELSGDERQRLARQPTANPEAYQAYLKGRHFLNGYSEEGLLRSIEYFEQAIDLDPGYALAYVGIAEAYWGLSSTFMRPAETMPKARTAAQRALEINDELAEAHAVLALVTSNYDWQWEKAEVSFKRAIALNPGDASAHNWYGLLLVFTGRPDQALLELHTAAQLDPLSSYFAWSALWPLVYAPAPLRRLDLAGAGIHKVIQMDPNFWPAHAFLGLVDTLEGQPEQATGEYEAALRLNEGAPIVVAQLAHVYALAGNREKAQEMARKLMERSGGPYLAPSYVAMIFVGLDDKDQAFHWLDKAYEERDENLLMIKMEPRFDPLHSDPRFDVLLRKMNLKS